MKWLWLVAVYIGKLFWPYVVAIGILYACVRI